MATTAEWEAATIARVTTTAPDPDRGIASSTTAYRARPLAGRDRSCATLRVVNDILLIDDDERLGEVLVEYAAQFGMTITPAVTPSIAFAALDATDFDAVILDVMLPEMDGFEVCRRIRASSDIPIVMLTARGEITDRVVGLEIGADDYLPKPFEPRELVARLQSNIKRYRGTQVSNRTATSARVRRFEGLSLHPESREVQVHGKAIDLTTMEYRFLTLLAAEPGRAFSRDEILGQLKGTEHELFSRSVDILVSRLRAKLRPATPIHTVHGAGYAFVARRLDAST